MIDRLAALIDAPGDPEAVIVATVVASPQDVRALADRICADAVWARGETTLVCAGAAARIEASGPERFDRVRVAAGEAFARVRDIRGDGSDDAPPPSLIGGFAFRPRPTPDAPWHAFADASFVLPRWTFGVVRNAGFVRLTARGRELHGGIDSFLTRVAPSLAPRTPAGRVAWKDQGEGYRALVRDALAHIERGELAKVVVANGCRARATRPFDVRATLQALHASHASTRFAVRRGDAMFVGASPETLVTRRGLVVEADALAGTSRDPRSRALLQSDKDRREHALVVRAVRAALSPYATLENESAPALRTLPGLAHLSTPVRGVLGSGAHVLELAEALHPTPAVCGTPRDAALAWIERNEPAPRGWYAGAVGWFDASGDGTFVVALRSAVIRGAEAWLYAGAGIVAGSDPDAELAETRLKLRVMLGALGACEPRLVEVAP